MDDFIPSWLRRLLDDSAYYRRMTELADNPLRHSPAYQDALKQFNEPAVQQAVQHFRQMADFTSQVRQSRYGSGGPAETKAAPKTPHPGVAVRALRKKRKWSQETLSTKSGVCLRTINDLERLRRIPKPINLANVMEALEKT